MIDLGIEPVAGTLPPTTLHLDEIDLLVHLLDIDVLPVVLDARPRFDSLPARDAVFRGAHGTLTAAGRVDGVAVDAELARALRVLARPDVELAARRYVDGAVHRACLAGADGRAVLALRSGDTVTIRALGPDRVGPLAQALGDGHPLPFGVVNCPTTALGAALHRLSDPAAAAAGLTALGVPDAEAAVVGPAVAGCTRLTEVVGFAHAGGPAPHPHGPVTVFDTPDGRVVGTTSIATDGVRWTSLSPGTPGRLHRALDDLLAQLT
ncbi:ESX secretion-associated protein EspG [Rhodococcus sp. SGAir0479]|uniref:ESX secretion-associated protein EspG n=1 Tax=Rhodococcus sp. SGAir0479 TaxID=2567884 RepID=UPI0010CCE287|nr:ESX secretion-associated protein EspG [Rhodococcus sp. SGAir0479]QCQ93169.1 ESX secretion-associated protein EspG [Rhodococcus sp. SGAir0479]